MAERFMACGCWYGLHAADIKSVLACAAETEKIRRMMRAGDSGRF